MPSQELAVQCVESDLLAQCPPGSNPLLGATADSVCVASVQGDLVNGEGAVSGRCFGQAGCQVACQFSSPCRCGVESVTRDGVVCVNCQDVAACGDGVCEGGEDPQGCPQDCAGECQPGAQRCQGALIEVCNLRGRWDGLPCPSDEVCEDDGAGRVECRRNELVDGGDTGGNGDDSGGPRISGRILFGDADLPEPAAILREGSGRDLRPSQTWGLLRHCGGNDFQAARCRQLVSETPRYQLVRTTPGVSGLKVTFSGEGPELALWGPNRAVLFSEDGFSPSRSERMPSAEAFCAAYSPCLGLSGTSCAEGEIAPLILETYASLSSRLGGAGLTCLVEGMDAECRENDRLQGECLMRDRVVGYGEQVTTPIDILNARMSDDGRFILHLGQGESSPTCNGHPSGCPIRMPILLYDTQTGEDRVIGGSGNYTAFGREHFAISADGRTAGLVVAAGTFSTQRPFVPDELVVLFWDLTSEGTQPISTIPLSGVMPQSLALSPDGRTAALALTDAYGQAIQGVDIYNVERQQLVYTILPAEPQLSNVCKMADAGLAFSPNGAQIATGYFGSDGDRCRHDGYVEVWDLPSASRISRLPNPSLMRASLLLYSPDGSTLVVAHTIYNGSGTVAFELALWEPESGERLGTVERLEDRQAWAGIDGMSFNQGASRLVLWGNGVGGDYAAMRISTYSALPEEP